MPAASGQQHRRNAKHEVLCMRWSDIAVRKKLYAVFVVGIGFFISIMVLILSFLYDVGEDAELLGRPRNDTELLTAEVGHLQWAMSVQDYVMNEGRIPLEAALDGRRCVFGTMVLRPEPHGAGTGGAGICARCSPFWIRSTLPCIRARASSAQTWKGEKAPPRRNTSEP